MRVNPVGNCAFDGLPRTFVRFEWFCRPIRASFHAGGLRSNCILCSFNCMPARFAGCTRGFVNTSPLIARNRSVGVVSAVVEQNVEVARHAAERPKQERNLAPMMNPVNGCVVH
jgi:hypothetical protein